jgi:Fur family transcriptional regulator, peroxide stress response regulator
MEIANQNNTLARRLSKSGLRHTPQRQLVYEVLLQRRDHPSAEEVFARVREQQPSISLATVYNCLETLVACELVKAVNHEREPTRYCPNLAPHAHFHDRLSGRVLDIDLPADLVERVRAVLPTGYQAVEVEIAFHGEAPGKPDATVS